MMQQPSVIDAVRKGNKQLINQVLRNYKLQNGAPNFLNLFSINSSLRLPALAKQDYEGTLDVVVAGVTLAVESMNLKRPMTGEQINDLAEELIDTSSEDNLSLEDVILFMQRLVRGQYGELYDSMDIPKFMEKFELYRQERHSEIVRIRENEHLQSKSLGDPTRSSNSDDLADQVGKVMDRMYEKNQRIKELVKQVKKNNDINNF